MYVYMDVCLLCVFYFEYRIIDVYLEYDLKDCYFKRCFFEG